MLPCADRIPPDDLAAMNAAGLPPSVHCCSGLLLSYISVIALIIIGSMAAAGVMPLSTAGWTTIGFGSTLLIGNLCAGNLKKHKWTIVGILTAATFILIGALGVTGFLSLKSLAIGVLVLAIVNPFFAAFALETVLKVHAYELGKMHAQEEETA